MTRVAFLQIKFVNASPALLRIWRWPGSRLLSEGKLCFTSLLYLSLFLMQIVVVAKAAPMALASGDVLDVERGAVLDPAQLLDSSPEALAQRQLNAYNAREIEAFLEPYSEDVEVYTYPGKLRYAGKSEMRRRYKKMFEESVDLHCELVNRIVLGNMVIDQEIVTSRGKEPVRALAIYTIQDGKISRIEFTRE